MGGDRYSKVQVKAFENEVIDDNVDHISISELETYNHNQCGLFITLDRTGSPTDIEIRVLFSPDNGETWFKNSDVWSGGSPSTLPVNEAFGGIDCPGSRAKVCITGSGCDSSNYFTVSTWLIAYRH